MLNDQQRSILQELKNRQLSPKQQAIIAELETRDSTPQRPESTEQKPSIMKTALQFGPAAALGQATEQGFNKAGEAIAETLSSGLSARSIPGLPIPVPQSTPGRGLRINPNAAAAIGAGVQTIPEAITSIAPGAGAAKVGNRAARAVGDTLFGEGAQSVRNAAKIAGETLQDRLIQQGKAAATVPNRALGRQQSLKVAKDAYGKAIGQAEEVGGFAMKETPQEFIDIIKNPKELNEMSKRLRWVFDTPSDKLADAMTPKQLQYIRKFAQTFRELDPQTTSTISSNIKLGGGKATEALKKLDPTFKTVIEDWQKVDAQLNRLPTDKIKQKAAIQGAMRQTRLAMTRTKRFYNQAIEAGVKRDKIRESLTKYVLGPAVGTAVGGTIWSFLK